MRLLEKRSNSSGLVHPSPALLSLFARYLRWYIPQSFHALRLAHPERFPRHAERLIVCLNHPSWWDPIVSIVLSRFLLPGTDHYAPMEASALRRYGFMRRLGLFPVDNQSPRAAAQFLRTAAHILNTPGSVLWVTPEGQFTDVRTRPVAWKAGLAALLHRAGECTVVPLALEYTFWDERRPEALALVGEPLTIADGSARTAEAWHAELLRSMAAAQDELAALAMLRDPARFTAVLRGRAGVGGVYEAWKRTQARLTGRHYAPEHGSIPHA